jgi:hypothetical protein
MEDFNSRVAKRRKELGLTQAELAKRAKMPQSTISQIENGRNKSSTDLLGLATALETTPDYLVYGIKESKQGQETKADCDSITLRYKGNQVSCGGGGMINPDFPELIRTMEIPLNRLHQLFGNINPDKLDIVGIKGDSMEPTLPRNGLAFIDLQVRDFSGDGIYAFFYIDGVYTKRLQKVPGKIIARSDNQYYEPFEITEEHADQFHIIGKYIGMIPLEFLEL